MLSLKSSKLPSYSSMNYRASVDGNIRKSPAAALVATFSPHRAPLAVFRGLRSDQQRAHGVAVHVVGKSDRKSSWVGTLGPQREFGSGEPKRARCHIGRGRFHVHVGTTAGLVVGARAGQDGACAPRISHPRMGEVIGEAAFVFVKRTAQRITGDRRQWCGQCSGQQRWVRA